MSRYFHPLLALIASATNSELAKYVEYLKYENKILRSRLLRQIHTTIEERKTLLQLGEVVGKAIHELITIVSPATFTRWLREENSPKSDTRKKKGGQRKPKELRELVLHIATNEPSLGLTRIVGELRKLGIKKISRTTVRNILKEEGISPEPDRKNDCWGDFLKRHAETLWATDFFRVKAVTSKGFQHLYVLVFLCLETREVIVSESTEHPTSAWVCLQTKEFIKQTQGRGEKKPQLLLHDRDTKYSAKFKATLEKAGIKSYPLPVASPNLNGRVEKFVGTIKSECLSRFIIFGKKHLDYLMASFVEYYNHHRSHTSRQNLPPLLANPPKEMPFLPVDQVVTRPHLGGLVKSFEKKAA
ncbi:MAG: DDE-type integrase/transposase/recombinase [Planctomycetaceae bacterium]|nr:DDE-type integrase/transposase/recombinase [Planctomycetaceae bacterium]